MTRTTHALPSHPLLRPESLSPMEAARVRAMGNALTRNLSALRRLANGLRQARLDWATSGRG